MRTKLHISKIAQALQDYLNRIAGKKPSSWY
jgi:hypothetical protein